MKIGLLLTIYNCDKYVEECLDPWFELKKDHDIIISAVSGMFVEYKAIGLPNRNKKTLEKLLNYDIDFQITTKGDDLLYEDESRNLCLDFLNKKNCDLIWVIDGDEVYTKEQILGIINFIENNKEYDWYELQFKNLTIYDNLFMSYEHGRIMWANRYGGIAYFYFDNKFIYNESNAHTNIKSIKIPKKIAYIKHYSWLSDDSRTKDKLLYQNIRYKNKYVNGDFEEVEENLRCSYVWNNDKNKLDFNESFYNFFEEEIPCLHEEVSCFSKMFDINYSRFDKCFYVTNISEDITIEFKIYNGLTNEHIYSTTLNMSEGIRFFIAPAYTISEDFTNFRIEAYENNILIHNERIHLKIKD